MFPSAQHVYIMFYRLIINSENILNVLEEINEYEFSFACPYHKLVLRRVSESTFETFPK